MIEKSIKNPAIAYTASLFGEYARSHGVDTDTLFAPSITTMNSYGPGSQSLRHGYGLTPYFEVSDSVPRTVPILLARFAIFDSRLNNSSAALPEDMDEKFGVYHDSVRWLRLVRVEPTDERVGEILSIAGASSKSSFEGVGHDECGNPTPYTGHYYMESDKYAIKVVQHAPEKHLDIPVTGIEFMLPDRTA